MVDFSDLATQFNQPTNALYQEKERLLQAKQPFVDLVSGNVTAHGLAFPETILAKCLAEAAKKTRTYQPHPLGQQVARDAIHRYYANDVSVPAGQIVLTPGTSLAYAYLFGILANPGDEILCPQPTYPLFDMIAAVRNVRLVGYPLRAGSRWSIDFDALRAAISPRTKAIVLVSPHNPTGMVATREEIEQLAAIARERQLPILADEVFCPFVFDGHAHVRPAASKAPLVFTLNGFSKMLALPGLKVGWIAVTGESALVRRALQALEMVSDTFLPVNEVVQAAVPAFFKRGAAFLRRYKVEVEKRMHGLVEGLQNQGVTFVPPEGGFYTAIPLPTGTDEDAWTLNLLREEQLLVHPGYFYEFEEPYVVLSGVGGSKGREKVVTTLARQISGSYRGARR